MHGLIKLQWRSRILAISSSNRDKAPKRVIYAALSWPSVAARVKEISLHGRSDEAIVHSFSIEAAILGHEILKRDVASRNWLGKFVPNVSSKAHIGRAQTI